MAELDFQQVTPQDLRAAGLGFNGDGLTLSGYSAARRRAGAAHNARVKEAARLYAAVLGGEEDPILLREAIFPRTDFVVSHLAQKYPGLYGYNRPVGLRETMSVTDYQALYVDVLDRMYYGYYTGYPIVNRALVKQHTLRDFRLVSRYLLDGVVTPLTAMDAAAPPPQRALYGPAPQDGATPANPATSTAPLQYQPLLYQAMTSVNWRAFVNDDLGIFQDLSKRLAIAGNRGISKKITSFFVDSAGPSATLYTSAYKNLIVTANGASINNPSLSTQGIMDALKILAGMRDSTGDPILMTGRMYLYYGPAYTAVAKNILNATKVQFATEAGTVSATYGFPQQWIEANNWLVQDMTPVMDPYIPIVCTAGGVQNTMWAIVVDPDTQNRPCVEFGQLAGYEVPQIYTKLPNTQRAGGGVDPMLGDFYTLDSDMKIITVIGGVQIDGRSTVASTGANA